MNIIAANCHDATTSQIPNTIILLYIIIIIIGMAKSLDLDQNYIRL